MSYKLIPHIVLVLILTLMACKSDPPPDPIPDHDYEISIISPAIDFININDTLRIEIEVKDLMGGIIENVNFRIYNLLESYEIYSKPENSNIAINNLYHFEDSLLLLELPPHSNWVLEAKAWGKTPSKYEVTKTFGFHVHSDLK